MKKLMTLTLITGLATAPMAIAQTSPSQADRILSQGTDYGITQFRSVEFSDGGYDDIELEGWMNDWYVELDMNGDGTIRKEERRKYEREPYGLSAGEIQDYLEAATNEGMATVDEIKVDRRGEVEVEGEDDTGRELELEFRKGELEPVRIKRDD
ncbi:PepSY domain-containing protein [Marinobacter oulmenensis]|uniref:PepSY domain-containing protein n=1 Tax=Marinobacter oulmenensis TaxID=643747 RepID=A0A840U5A1_9GAMM|nr:PepSY domain-containing protein [Marinobacter oulmenensis]MBB5320102.1 hypothetical protein [Marinobacter oulmenensis]